MFFEKFNNDTGKDAGFLENEFDKTYKDFAFGELCIDKYEHRVLLSVHGLRPAAERAPDRKEDVAQPPERATSRSSGLRTGKFYPLKL